MTRSHVPAPSPRLRGRGDDTMFPSPPAAALAAAGAGATSLLMIWASRGREPGVHYVSRLGASDKSTAAVFNSALLLLAFAAVMMSGASGFLVKDTPPEELMAAIRAVAAGDALVSPRVTRTILDMFASRLPAAPTATPERLRYLSEREREVFVAITEGLTNSEIAERFRISESTVKTHVGRVLTKIHARDRVHAVILAYELGIV